MFADFKTKRFKCKTKCFFFVVPLYHIKKHPNVIFSDAFLITF